MGYSMTFSKNGNSINVKARPFPTPRMTLAQSWAQDSAGNWHVTDRGAAEDVHEADVTLFGPQSEMNVLADWLEAHGREDFAITSFDGTVFSPIVDHSATGGVRCTLVGLGRMRQAFASPEGEDVLELSATLRALAPSSTKSVPSIARLRLQSGFEADKSTDVRKLFYYDTNAFFVDERSDSGRFVGSFRQRLSETQSILRYFLYAQRSKAIPFPSLHGVEYPFGKAHGTLPKKCRVKGISVFRVNLKVWELKIEFVEEREIA